MASPSSYSEVWGEMVVPRLTLLGTFSLRQDGGADIDLLGEKDRALLAFLAVAPGASHARERVSDLLWGEHGETQARDSLRHALTRLRQCLGSAIRGDR